MRQTINHPKLIGLWKFKKGPTDRYFLALCGDIGNPSNPLLREFLSNVSPMYEKVFYVPGNHEYYHTEKCWDGIHQDLKSICDQFDNVFLMDNRMEKIDENIIVIGSTLWTNIPESQNHVSDTINDYRLIKKVDQSSGQLTTINIDDTNSWNDQCVKFIHKQIDSVGPGIKCIVLTHHAPLFSDLSLGLFTADQKYLDSKNNYAFHNDLASMFVKPVCVWIYGHTHYTSKTKYRDVVLATNQLGYSHEESDIKFDPYAWIDLAKL